MHDIRNIAIFCGAKTGKAKDYELATRELAACLVKKNIGVVYGGAKVGLMGCLADEILSLSGSITGVIPQSLVDIEVAHSNLPALHIVESMSERKCKMADISDAFIMLPGGVGSLDEFFEMFTLSQLGYHQKPCAILNVNGYYDHLLAYMKHAVSQEFLADNDFKTIIIEKSPETLINKMLDYSPVHATEWETALATS